LRVYSAEPARVASFSPARKADCLLVRHGRMPRRAHAMEFMHFDYLDAAPIAKLEDRFVETMRAKGWLK